MGKILTLASLVFLFLATPVLAQNTPDTDYQYQLDQYNRYHSEFVIYQKDYLKNNTLDNEQKAIQTARNTLLARELTMYSYMRILQQSIQDTRMSHPAITSTLSSMNLLGTYYQQQADLINNIQTKQDLANYSAAYQVKIQENQAVLDSAQIINKLSQLIKLEKDLEQQMSLLTPQLEPKRNVILVQNSLQEIAALQQKVNSDIDTIAVAAKDVTIAGSYRKELFRKITMQAVAVQANERKIAQRLIDLDTNYVAR